ncbi:MAG: kelch repeat-containing protein, partial [Cyanobacteria bacterium J06641_5]
MTSESRLILPHEAVAASPIARFESGVAVARNKMFVIGGHMEPDLMATVATFAYDPATDLWSQCQDAPKAISHVTASVVDDRYIWLVGGYEGQHPGSGTAASFRYDVDEDRWETGPPLPKVRASGGLALVGRQLHYFGGLGADRITNFDDHWILNVDNPLQWEKQAPIPFARTHAATAVIGNHIYAIGGHFGHDVPGQIGKIDWTPDLDYVHRFDPVADTWEEVAPLSRRRSHCEPGTFVYDGKIICIGGRNNSPSARSRHEKTLLSYYLRRLAGKVKKILDPDSVARKPWLGDIIAYDPARDKWLDLGLLPQALYKVLG